MFHEIKEEQDYVKSSKTNLNLSKTKRKQLGKVGISILFVADNNKTVHSSCVSKKTSQKIVNFMELIKQGHHARILRLQASNFAWDLVLHIHIL